MTRIDELPLELFGESEPSLTAESVRVEEHEPDPAVAAARPVAESPEIPPERRKLYDALIVCALIVGIGLVFQILRFNILTPIINAGAGVLFYQMASDHWRQRQRWRIERLVRGFNHDVERMRNAELARANSEMHLVYDGMLVLFSAFILRLAVEAAGFGWVLPGRAGWFIAICLAILIYVKLVLPRRADVHLWLDAHLPENKRRAA
jgi:hypothetical protein